MLLFYDKDLDIADTTNFLCSIYLSCGIKGNKDNKNLLECDFEQYYILIWINKANFWLLVSVMVLDERMRVILKIKYFYQSYDILFDFLNNYSIICNKWYYKSVLTLLTDETHSKIFYNKLYPIV